MGYHSWLRRGPEDRSRGSDGGGGGCVMRVQGSDRAKREGARRKHGGMRSHPVGVEEVMPDTDPWRLVQCGGHGGKRKRKKKKNNLPQKPNSS